MDWEARRPHKSLVEMKRIRAAPIQRLGVSKAGENLERQN